MLNERVDKTESTLLSKWEPNQYLTNMCMNYFMNAGECAAIKMLPICLVPERSGECISFNSAYYFDNVSQKPSNGKVNNCIKWLNYDISYNCIMHQIILQIDSFASNQRAANGKDLIEEDSSCLLLKFIANQMALHLDKMCADLYFKSNNWKSYSGVDNVSYPDSQFYKFTNEKFRPIIFFNEAIKERLLRAGKAPNKLFLGFNAYSALINHPEIIQKISFVSGDKNSSIAKQNVLAQILGFEEVCVLDSVYNDTGGTQYYNESLQFIYNPNDALMIYSTSEPSMTEQSAGYTYTWDIFGDGNWLMADQYNGLPGNHTESLEASMHIDMKVIDFKYGSYLYNCV